MKRGLTLAFTVTVVFAMGLHDIVSAESSGAWIDAELIYIGELRGSRFTAVTYSDGETKYEGIMDIQGGYALEPSSGIIVTEGQDAGDDNIQYYGGKDIHIFPLFPILHFYFLSAWFCAVLHLADRMRI